MKCKVTDFFPESKIFAMKKLLFLSLFSFVYTLSFDLTKSNKN